MLNEFINKILNQNYHPVLFYISFAFLWVSSLLILISVIYKFVEYKDSNKKAKKKQKHIIETFSMTAFIIILFNLLQKNIGIVKTDFITHIISVIFGGIIVILNTYLHILAKINLGKLWSNQIEIQKNHKLITSGAYSIARHPMYSSIIFWLLGLALMFNNWLVFILNLLVYIPAMVWRAKAEDKNLEKLDKAGFKIYSKNVKMLLPKFSNYISNILKITGILFLGYSIVMKQMSFDRVLVLAIIHLFISINVEKDKVRFSYRNKSFFLIIFFIIIKHIPDAYFLYYMILIFNIYGLFFNCPCMIVYEKYKGCPCFKGLTCGIRKK